MEKKKKKKNIQALKQTLFPHNSILYEIVTDYQRIELDWTIYSKQALALSISIEWVMNLFGTDLSLVEPASSSLDCHRSHH